MMACLTFLLSNTRLTPSGLNAKAACDRLNSGLETHLVQFGFRSWDKGDDVGIGEINGAQ